MKKLLKIAILLLLPFFARTQPKLQLLDSLHVALNSATNDTIRMITTQRIYEYYIEKNWDSALYYTEKSLVLSNKMNQPLWTARILLHKAYIIQKQGNLPLVFKLINEAMAIAKEEKNEKNVYIKKDFEYFGDPHNYRLGVLGGAFHQLGNMYTQARNKEKAISCFKEVIRIGIEINRESSLVNSNMNIGSIYLDWDKLDSAIIYSNKALMYSIRTGYKTYQGNMLKNIGTIYFKMKLLDSAKHYYWQSLSVNREQGNFASEVASDISLAKFYESISQPDSMLYYAQSAFKIALALKVGNEIGVSSQLISGAFKLQGITDSAFAYLSISKTVGDSTNKERNEKLTQFQHINFEEQLQLEKTAQESIAYKNKIRTIALFAGLALFSILAFVFYRNNRQKQKANKVLETTLSNLKSTQSQLIHSEKMASLGELTAGIAHEIQNPLNFVNNFSEVNAELIDELNEEAKKGNLDEVMVIAKDIKEISEKINHHGKRADAIVKGMLQHSRSSNGVKEPTDINALADEYLRLSYHGLRAKDKLFNATLETDFDDKIGNINIIPQDIGRVMLNLINNAFYTVDEKKKQHQNGYVPTVSLTSKKNNGKIEIKVSDNGNGIPQKVLDKIFQPFFTTKPTGEGTGLGLSLSYDIIKAHGGEIMVNSKDGEGAEFIIQLPI